MDSERAATRRMMMVGSAGWLHYGNTTSMSRQVRAHLSTVREGLPNESKLRDMQRKGMNFLRVRVEFLKKLD